MRVFFRSLLELVLLVFATTALYIQAQWVYHNHGQGWWGAILMVISDNIIVTVIALLIIIGAFFLEYYLFMKENKESEARIKQLNNMSELLIAIANKLSVDTKKIVEDKDGKPKQ